MIGNSILFDESDEMLWRVASQCRLAKMRIGGKKILGAAMKVGEVATAAARNQDLLANAIGMIEYNNSAPALASLNRAHQASRTSAHHDGIERLLHRPRKA